MAQVDSENSIAMPIAPTSGAGLAKQQRDREKTQKRLAKLRAKASDEIERLLSFLDASDPYAATELEDSIDDEACDTNELEPSLGWTSTEAKSGRVASPADVDREGDAREDDEPSLGSVGSYTGDQCQWADAGRDDREGDDADNPDGEEVNEDGDGSPDNEPSVGWTVDGLIQNTSAQLCDIEEGTAPAEPQGRTAIDRERLTVENTYRRFLRGLPADQAERVRHRARRGTDVIVVR